MQTAPEKEIPYTHIIDAGNEQRYETSCEVYNASCCCVSSSGHFRIRKGRMWACTLYTFKIIKDEVSILTLTVIEYDWVLKDFVYLPQFVLRLASIFLTETSIEQPLLVESWKATCCLLLDVTPWTEWCWLLLSFLARSTTFTSQFPIPTHRLLGNCTWHMCIAMLWSYSGNSPIRTFLINF